MQTKEKRRNGFASGLGFILATAGSAVGLGNLWSFPYKTSANGGAAFVIVYVLSAIFIGSVVMAAELHLGRRAQANPVTAFKKVNKNFGWLGLFAVIIPFIVMCYYSILGGYTVKYAMNSFNDNSEILKPFAGNVGEVIIYTAIFLLLAVVVVTAGVKGGIEKVSKVLMPVLFIILVAIVIYCLCLGEGVEDGLAYYLKPDFTALGLKGVLAAMGQAFYSMSLGMGIMVSYGSYTGKNVKIGMSVFMIVLFDTLVALLAGLAIFPAIYHYKATTGISLQDNGIVLLFASMPLIFNTLGVMGKIVSFFFFGMVAIAALTSIISLLEVVTQFFIQRFRLSRKKAIAVVGIISFIVSVPISISLGFALNGKEGLTVFGLNYLDLFDTISNTVLMPVCALGACLAVGWFMFNDRGKKALSVKRLSGQLKKDGLKLGKADFVFALMIKYVTPVVIAFIEVMGLIDVVFPKTEGGRIFSENGFGLALISFVIMGLAIAVYFIFMKNKDSGCNADEIYIIEEELKKKRLEEEIILKTEKAFGEEQDEDTFTEPAHTDADENTVEK